MKGKKSEPLITTDHQELQSRLNKIMKEAEALERHIKRFTGSIHVAFKYNPKLFQGLSHAFTLIDLVRGLEDLWNLMERREEGGER